MIIQYKINKKINKIRIFGSDFVSNNKKKLEILYDNKYYQLNELFDIKSIKETKNILELKLIKLKNITDMRTMFQDCSLLLNIVDSSHWNTNNIINMSNLF